MNISQNLEMIYKLKTGGGDCIMDSEHDIHVKDVYKSYGNIRDFY
ncbi:MAG: hypothetical protein ACFE85_15830 [Candidatus Hodarchaeota archaeon]